MKLIVTATLMLAAVTFAQSTDPATISQRKENQQDRIANGVQSGQLTAGETKSLESKEANLNPESRRRQTHRAGEAADQRAAESSQQSDLCRQTQLQYRALRQQRSGAAARESAGSHRSGDSQRTIEAWPDRQTGESRTGNQSAGPCRPAGQRRKVDRPGKAPDQRPTESREPGDLSQ
jgi:hypothetical protein